MTDFTLSFSLSFSLSFVLSSFFLYFVSLTLFTEEWQEVKRQLQQIKNDLRNMQNRTSFLPNSVTRAEAVQDLVKNGKMKNSQELDDTLLTVKVKWWPKGVSRTTFPKKGDGDKTVCQPFVNNMLTLFANGTIEVVHDSKQPGNKSNANKPSITTETIKNIPDPKAYGHASLGRKRFDAVFYDGLKKTGPCAIVMYGEVQSCENGMFPDEEVGQLTDGLKRLLDEQPFRSTAIGFLTDGNRFYFIQCTRCTDDGRDEYETSSIFQKMEGWQVVIVHLRVHMQP